MNTLTNKDKLALQVSLALVAGMFSFVPTVHAAPVLDKDVTGGATITTGTDTTITSTIDNNVINWADFSVGSGESVTFDGGEKSVANGAHNYLNVVTGNGTSYINGAMRGGNDVYLVNPQGVIMGESANIDVGNLYVSTQDSSNLKNIIDGKSKWDGTSSSVLSPSTVQAEVVNMGKITANSVYVEGTNIRFLNTADIVSADDGEVLKKVTLKSSSDGYVHVGYLTADPGEADYKDKKAGEANKASVLYSDTKIVDYMLVNNEDEFENIKNNLSGNYMLADDITLTVKRKANGALISNHEPIGEDSSTPFTGKLDGNFFSVENVTVANSDGKQYSGVFGYTDGARIENIKIVNPHIYASMRDEKTYETVTENNIKKERFGAGGIVGYAKDTTLINVANVVLNPKDKQGKVVVIANAGDTSSIAVEGGAGGLVGWSAGSTNISGSYNEALIGDGNGLVGNVLNKGLVLKNSYNAGNIQYGTDTSSSVKYYGLYGGEANASNIVSSYNSGKFYTSSNEEDTSSHTIGPSGGTNCIDNATSTSQSDYPGLFSGTETANDTWRIYEGHSLPLLRSFLKANSHGTVALNYNVGLYAEENDTTPRAVIPGVAGKNLTYNGYYMGVANKDKGGNSISILSSSDANGLDSSMIGYNDTKVRDVTAEGDSGVNFFYSKGGQNGYDLADSSIKVVARSLAPVSGDVYITKVYDGTTDASKAFGDALTLSKNAVDVAAIYNGETVNGITYKAGTLVETGLVKVTKSDGTVVKTDAVTLDTSGLTATYASGENVVTKDTVNLIFPNDPDSMLKASSDTDHATDYTNYTFDTTPFDTKAIKVIGDITQRPVQVSLTQATGIDKIYDGTSQVIDAVAPADAEKDNLEKHKYLTGNITEEKYNASDDKGRGIITDDLKKVEVAVNSAYYSTDGTAAKKTAQANDTANAYKAIYNLEFSGDSTKIKNYKFQDTSGNDLTDNVLTGTGTIAKRNVTLDNIAFLDKDGKEVDNKKTYDYTSAYTDATQVSFESDAVATEEEALAQTKVTGILKDDKGSFNFTLDTTTNSPKFYDSNTGTPKEAKTVSDAKYIKYTLATAGDADVLKNYTLNGEAITNGNVSVYREGEIEKRAISVAMLTDSGIDKTYDAKAAVVDGSNKGYLDFKGTGASGTTTTKGYVGYADDTDHKLVVDNYGKTRNDGTAFSISAEYTTAAAVGAGTTTNAADVYVDDNKNAAAKKIKYTVSLTGDNAANYTLNGKDSNEVELEATGTINPRKITAIKFGDVSKKYDGTATVGEVNGVTQTSNQITIAGVTIDDSDGLTLNESGLLGDDTYDAVLGTTGGVISAGSEASKKIKGTYGTPGWTTSSSTAFKADEHAHADSGSTTGKSRQVQYTGVQSLTSSNHNYTTDGMDDTQYGKGTINPLTIDTITTSGTGEVNKVYDGTKNVVGGYQMTATYADNGDITIENKKISSDEVKSKLGTVTIKGEGVGGQKVSVDLADDAYSVDTNKTLYDSAHVKDVSKIVYAVELDADNGDYVLADSGSGYTKSSTGLALIDKENKNLITARVLKTSGVTGLTKTYDGTTDVVDDNGNKLTGDKVVKFEDKTEVTGLTGNDGVTNISVAEYAGDLRDGYAAKDANIYTDGVQESVSGNKKVKYTVKLSGTYADTDYEVFKDTNYDGKFASAKDDGNTYTVADAKYGGNIKQKDLKVSFSDIEKIYDSNAYVMDYKDGEGTTHTVTLTAGKDNTSANLKGLVSGDAVSLVTQSTSAFQATDKLGAEDVGEHEVKYDLVSTSSDLKNYRLVNSDGSKALEFTKTDDGYTVTAYGKGTIDKRTIDEITAVIDKVSKVYDGGTSLTYVHNADNGYDDSQKATVDKITSVKSLTLGKLTITTGFHVDEDKTKYADANVGSSKAITYTLVLEKDALGNFELEDGLGNYDSDGNFVFTKDTNNNAITAKNVYASLNDKGQAANPTKSYDGTTNLLNLAKSNGSKVDQTAANSYVTISGMVNGDTAYTVTPTYDSKDVAVVDGKVASKENVVNYVVNGLSKNYNLKTKDDTATVTETDKEIEFYGKGTIEPKALTLEATLAEKVYDTHSDVDLTTGTGVTSVPTLTLKGLVGTDSITIATTGDNAIEGNYGTYANGAFEADPNVAFVDNAEKFDASEVTYKAVQYSNAKGSFIAGNGTTKLTNYTLADGSDHLYNADKDTLTFTKDKGKGKITKLAVSKIEADIDTVTKVYDGNTSLTYDYTNDLSYDSTQRNKASAGDKVKNIKLGDVVTLDYGYTVDDEYTQFNSPDAGENNKDVTYRFNIEGKVIKNLELTGNQITTNDDGSYTFDQVKTGNTITPKNVYATLSDTGKEANPTKVYDGNTDVFNIAEDNGTTVTADKAKSYVTIKGLRDSDSDKYTVTAAEYQKKDVEVDGDALPVEGANKINYTVGVDSNNYKIKAGDITGTTNTDNTVKLVGKGTIDPRPLTLVAGIATKTYDMSETVNMTAKEAGDIAPEFKLENVLAGESVNFGEVTGEYGTYENKEFTADPNVALDDNNEATYKAVRYSKVRSYLSTNDPNTVLTNYTFADDDVHHAYDIVNDKLVFSAAKRKGLINKRDVESITPNFKDATKVYDGDNSLTYDHTDVDLHYDEKQNKDKHEAKDFVNSITLNTNGLGDVVVDKDSYSVEGNYETADVDTGKKVTYNLSIGKDFARNYDLHNLEGGSYKDGAFNFNEETNNNSITPKNIYAALSETGEAVNPTKVYDGNVDVFGVATDGEDTVDADKAKTYVTVTGLVGKDSYKVLEAAYNDKNVAVEGKDTDTGLPLPKEKANDISYTVGDVGKNYNLYVDSAAKGTNNNNNTVNLVGTGTITPRPLTLEATIAQKTYDMTDKVKMTDAEATEDGDKVPTFKLKNVVDGESVQFGAVSGKYGTYVADTKEFTADPNVELDEKNNATYKAVQYSSVRGHLQAGDDNTKLSNYTFADDTEHHAYDIVNDKLVFSADKEMGKINKRSVEKLEASYDSASKAYDGEKSVAYNHTEADYYDEDQRGSKEAADFVKGVTLKTVGLGDVAADYSVVDANYDNANAGKNKEVTYGLTIGRDFARNYALDNALDSNDNADGSYDNNGNFNFSEKTKGNTITPKNIYASLTDEGEEADPTKEYDGTKEVFGKAMDGETVVDENKVKESYIDLPGFVDNDSYTVSAAYNNKNVKKARSIKYTIKDVSPNYKLYTKDSDGEVSESNSLMGGGTITPRGLTLSADLAQKTYDGNANVKFKITEDGDKVPTFSLPTGVEGEEIKLDSSIITGVYGTYTDADGFVADANVALDGNNKATYKAVQYSNVGKSLSAGNDQTDMSNYKLVNYKDAHLYNSATDELTFLATKEKGLITKRKVNEIGTVIDEIVDKVYDGETSLTYDHTAEDLEYDDTQNKDKSNASDYVHGVTLTTDQQKNVDAVYSVAADYDTAKAGENKDITYKMTMGVDFARNYEMDSIKNGEYDSDGNFILTETTKGNTITAKNIYASLNDDGLAANPTKEYDGTTDVLNVTVDGGKVVDEAKAKSYVKVKGLVGDDKDKYKVDAVYNDKNVVVDDNGEVQTKAHKVTYTVDGIDDNYKLHDVDGNHNDKNTATLTGTGTITPREIKLESDLAQKTYDQNANVKLTNENLETGDSLPNLRVETGVKGESINTSVSSGVYGNIVDGTFNEDANVALDADRNAAYKAVKYSGVKLSEGNKDTDLKNYKLVDGEAVLTDGDWVFAADTQKGLITKRGIAAVDADIDPFSKVYDGTASLIYNHTASDYEDPNQVEQKAAITNINGVTLGTYAIEADDYSVEEANTKFDNAGVSIGDKAITYALRVNSDVISNYDVAEGLGNWNDDYSFTFTKETNKNSITPKNVYASLVDNLNPTKVYDGTITVIGAAKNNNEGDAIDQAAANSFVNLKGLLDGEDNITVTPTYQNKNVEVDDKGKAQAGKNAINYVISGVNGNYNLYTKDADGNISAKPNDTLVGDGTINQKEINLKVGYAEKAYDAKSDVNLVKTDTSADDDKYPTFTVSGEIAGEKLKFAISGDNAIKGNYGIYDDATGTFTADHNVDFDGDKVTYKAVQYSNVYGSLTGDKGYENTLATNYKFNLGNEKYNDDDDTLTFTVGQEKGKITQRIISGTETTWADSIVKEYDATSAIPDEDISKGFNIVGVSKVGDSEIKIPIAYTVTNAGFGSETEGIKDVGTNLPVFYRIEDISQEDLGRNFKLADDFYSRSYVNYFENKDGIGEITPRIISGKATAALQEKIYDGNTSAEAGTTYFNIDQDDLDVLKKDGIADNVNVTGAYENKNANIDPNEVAKGGKVINYTMSWADGTADKNYIFADDNGTGEDYQGKGDIRRRKVYVVDKGGDVLTKTYDGTTALADGTNLSGRFGFEAADSEAQTGIIDSGVALKNADINGAYVSKDVARDDSGKVINKGVQFTGFGLEDINITGGNDDAGNYYLAVKDSTGTIPLSGNSEEKESAVNYAGEGDNIVITEVKGGRIEPKNITVSLKKSPTKVYDTDTLVKGGYVDEDGNTVAYASASNLEAAADGANVSRSFGNANNVIFDIVLENGTTDTIEVAMDGTANYGDKNVSRNAEGKVLQDKVTSYNLSWNNSNYDLSGDFTADGTNGYTSDGSNNRTGVLQDKTGEITPYTISVKSVDSAKTYDGSDEAKNPKVTATFDSDAEALINKDMAGSENVNSYTWVGITAEKGKYGAPTDKAVKDALAKNADVTKAATADEIAEAETKDAAFNRTADPFQHHVSYSGLALSNGNYELDKDTFEDGTGIINRATVTAHGSSATMTASKDMPTFTGTLTGFVEGETATVEVTETIKNEDGTTSTKTTFKQVPLAEYYNDAEHIYWGPEANVTGYSLGEHDVYGWYRIRREELAYNEDGTPKLDDNGNQVYNYYWNLYKEANLDKNYTLKQDPGTFKVNPSSGGGSSTPTPASEPTPTPTPASEPAATPASEPATVTPVVDFSYVDKPVTPDSNVYQNVSKVSANVSSHEADATIQYGSTGAGIATDNSSEGTIGIELSEVVNLLGGDVASDGTVSLSNADGTSEFTVGSTEEGYLSVDTNNKDGSIGIETEDESLYQGTSGKDGSIGIETEEGLPAESADKEGIIGIETEDGLLVESADKEGSISLETEDGTLLASDDGDDTSDENIRSTRKSSIGLKSDENDIVSGDDRLAPLEKDEKDEKDEDEDKEDEEESEGKEGQAAITYSDVA